MVYYRKYRPQTIADLDLAAVRERLTSILQAKELPHAFLFTGPKGLGKTSSARILAKAINCDERVKGKGGSVKETPSIEPCNKCENCKSITNGSNLDVIEIDAASNRGIDEIRDLREKIKFSPATLPKKVYIIDEVHMLTNDAFNALLKTLEEPPAHAVFILCTTELEKVPPTIISRAFHVTFQKPTLNEVVGSLNRIVKGEKLDVDKNVLDRIFSLSEGSFRDAAKILEDLAFSAGNEKITLATVEKNYKSESIDQEAVKLINALAVKNLSEALKIIEILIKKGVDFKFVTEKLASILHAVILIQAGVSETTMEVPKNLNPQDAGRLLELINESYKNIKLAVMPQLPLELVVVEWCVGGRIQNLESGIKNKEKEIASDSLSPRNDKEEKQVVNSESNAEKKDEKPKSEDKASKNEQQTNNENPHGVLFRANGKSEDFFATFLAALKHDNHSIAGILRGCRLVEISGSTVTFETKYKFHKDKLSEAKTRTVLDARASEILREDVHVVVNLLEK